jgi:hypothetical protein
MAQKKKARTRSGKTVPELQALVGGRTQAEWAEEIRKEQAEEVKKLVEEANQLPSLLDIGAAGTDFSLTPLSHVPKLMHAVSFVFDYLLEPGTEIDPAVVVGLSCALRECAQRTSEALVKEANKKLRALAPAEEAKL